MATKIPTSAWLVGLAAALAWNWAWVESGTGLLTNNTVGDEAGCHSAGPATTTTTTTTTTTGAHAAKQSWGLLWADANFFLGAASATYLTGLMLFRAGTFEYIRTSEILVYAFGVIVALLVGVLPRVLEETKPFAVEFAPISTWIVLVAAYSVVVVNLHGREPGPSLALDGHIAIVTGSNSGIGAETAKRLASLGAEVVMACRSTDQAVEIRDAIVSATGNSKVHVMRLDLNSFQSVRDFAAEFTKRFDRLDILCNNAGVMLPSRQESGDGHEVMLQGNFLAPILLCLRLYPALRKGTLPGGPRIVNVSSSVSRFPSAFDFDDPEGVKSYSLFKRYGMSKLALNLATSELARRARKHGVHVHALNPGTIRTKITRSYHSFLREGQALIAPINKNVWQGSNTTIYVCTSPDIVREPPGSFFEHAARTPMPLGDNPRGDADKLWKWMEDVLGESAKDVGLVPDVDG